MKKTLLLAGAVLLALGLAAAGYVAWQAHAFLDTAPESPGSEVVVDVRPGSTFDQVARMLVREGVITDAAKFRLLGRWEKKLGSVKAGEFRLSTGWTPDRVLAALTSGTPVLHRLSVPEGLTWWQIGRIVERSGLATFESFERAVHDKELLAEYDIPSDNAEGYLFPETYHLPRPRGGDARPIVRAMLAAFWEQAGDRVWPGGRPAPEELDRIVTLASMVEKETADVTERERIAGVYANRLRIGMLMQCDPTVIYGLGTAFDGNLTKAHLRDKSNPYNTYRRRGLPPGPICSPGYGALAAAKNPEKHKFLYFVAKGDGSHAFSRTLVEHNAAVRKYQLRRRR